MQSKFVTHFVSAGALMLALSGGAFAAGEQYGGQQTGQMQGQAEQMPGQAGQMQQAQVDFSNVYKASSLQNLEVQGSQGENIGQISEVLIDKNGQVSHVVVSEGGGLFGAGGGQNYLVPWQQLQIDDQQQIAMLNVSSDQMDTQFSAFEEIPPTSLEQGGQMQQQPQQQPPQEPPMDGMGTESPTETQ